MRGTIQQNDAILIASWVAEKSQRSWLQTLGKKSFSLPTF